MQVYAILFKPCFVTLQELLLCKIRLVEQRYILIMQKKIKKTLKINWSILLKKLSTLNYKFQNSSDTTETFGHLINFAFAYSHLPKQATKQGLHIAEWLDES